VGHFVECVKFLLNKIKSLYIYIKKSWAKAFCYILYSIVCILIFLYYYFMAAYELISGKPVYLHPWVDSRAASELGPELKIAILVGSGILTGTTLVGSEIFTGTTLVGTKKMILCSTHKKINKNG